MLVTMELNKYNSQNYFTLVQCQAASGNVLVGLKFQGGGG